MSKLFHNRDLIFEIPTNSSGQWKDFFFITSEFLPSSREKGANTKSVHMDVPHELTAEELKDIHKISDVLALYECDRGVPFALFQREDFSFTDVAKFSKPAKDSEGNP